MHPQSVADPDRKARRAKLQIIVYQEAIRLSPTTDPNGDPNAFCVSDSCFAYPNRSPTADAYRAAILRPHHNERQKKVSCGRDANQKTLVVVGQGSLLRLSPCSSMDGLFHPARSSSPWPAALSSPWPAKSSFPRPARSAVKRGHLRGSRAAGSSSPWSGSSIRRARAPHGRRSQASHGRRVARRGAAACGGAAQRGRAPQGRAPPSGEVELPWPAATSSSPWPADDGGRRSISLTGRLGARRGCELSFWVCCWK